MVLKPAVRAVTLMKSPFSGRAQTGRAANDTRHSEKVNSTPPPARSTAVVASTMREWIETRNLRPSRAPRRLR